MGEAQVLLRIGDTIDRYRIEALVGQGGMAAVYRVRHAQLDSEHALKVLFITSPKVISRLLREGRVQANLRHPNIVAVTDVLHVRGAPALVMEYVDGPALDTWLIDHKPTLQEGLWLFRGILRGVAAAHERGVVHRDLKPANVLLAPTEDGLVPKVTDFGLVKSLYDQRSDTQQGVSLGTPEYMSPEQIRDASGIDARADMWALGCVLYEIVCHRRAFQGADKMSTFNLIVGGQYEPPRQLVPDLPRNISEAIRSLLEIDRDKRLARCDELYELLYDHSEHQEGRIAAPSRPVIPLRIEPSLESAVPSEVFLPTQLSVPTAEPALQRVTTPRNQLTKTSIDTERPRLAPRQLRRVTTTVLTGLLLVSIVTALLLWMTKRRGAVLIGPALADSVRPSAPVGEIIVVGLAPSSSQEDEPFEDEAGSAPSRAGPVGPPAPAGVAEDSGGWLRVVGDATSVWLVRDGVRMDPGDRLAAGPYQVVASFDGGSASVAGEVVVWEGMMTTLHCSKSSRICREK